MAARRASGHRRHRLQSHHDRRTVRTGNGRSVRSTALQRRYHRPRKIRNDASNFSTGKRLGAPHFCRSIRSRTGKGVAERPTRRVTGCALGYAHTLVRTAPRFAGIVNFLVGNVLIVTTLQVGIELVRGRGLRDTIVTLGGEQITGGGAITGGRFARERSILSRRFQAASLRDALVGMRAKLEEAERGLRAAHLRADAAIGDARRCPGASGPHRIAVRGVSQQNAARWDPRSSACTAIWKRLARRRWNCARGRRDAASSNASTSAKSQTAQRGEDERIRLELELARVREEIVRAEAAQTSVNAQGAQLRERAAALTAERDASKARLAMLDQDSERGGLAREEMLAQIAGTDGRDPAQPRARRGASPRRRNARFAARGGSPRARRACRAPDAARIRVARGRAGGARDDSRGRASSHAARPSRGGARHARFAVRTESRDQR